jgi:hypothetical protein
MVYGPAVKVSKGGCLGGSSFTLTSGEQACLHEKVAIILDNHSGLYINFSISKFGDGIISMIDCKVHLERKPDPKG